MARFERDEIEARRLPTPLGTATEDLRSTIETEVTKIVSRAEERAAEIENQALAKASRIEQESERRAHDVFQDSRERVVQMLGEIDGIERSVADAVRSLRNEAERLTSELSAARSASFEPSPPPAPVTADPNGAQASDELVELDELHEIDETEALGEEEPNHGERGEAYSPELPAPEVREMIRQQLLSMAEGGRNRADAERMLLRFKQGELYFDLLDEIYPEETSGRRGLLRRRKAH